MNTELNNHLKVPKVRLSYYNTVSLRVDHNSCCCCWFFFFFLMSRVLLIKDPNCIDA